jgi:hypothetical protein
VTGSEGDDRGRRVRRARDAWRKEERVADDAVGPGPESEEGDEERRADALGPLDEIRSEAPENDLETRRAADQFEREIERSRKRRS